MALILNIETSSEICSVALSVDGVETASLESRESRSHASVLTVLINDILQKSNLSVNNLDAIAVSMGPGSYTGLRIGVSAAKGLCYGAGKPLIAVNTLLCMINGLRSEMENFETRFSDETIFCPMLDARRQEVYLAWFSKQGEMIRDTSAEIIDTDSFKETLQNHQMIFFGTGAGKCKTIIPDTNAVFIDDFSLKAAYMCRLTENLYQKGVFEDVAYFEPFYLKDFVATIPRRKVM